MKHTKQTIILLLAAALACGCGGQSDENKAVAKDIAAYVDGLKRGYKPMASTAMLTGRTWTSTSSGYLTEMTEDISFTDSTYIKRTTYNRTDRGTSVYCDTSRYYLSIARKPEKFEYAKVGKQTNGDYIIKETTYKGKKTFVSLKILFVSPARLELDMAYSPIPTIGGTGKRTYVREK